MTAHQVGVMLLGLAAIIVLARLLGALARRLGQPPVIGEIVAGILVGPTLFGTAVSGWLFPVDVRPALAGLANVGLVLFMFIVGYELDHTLVRGKERVAASVSIGSILLPFGLGVVLALWLAGNHQVTRPVPFALFIGAAMSVTAFPVLARILTDRGMQRIPVGGLALASAAVDDIIAWSLLAVVVTIGGAGADQWHVLFALPYVLLMFLGVRPLLRRLSTAYERAGRLTPTILAIILCGLLLSCYATEWLGVHFIFGAFIFGTVMPRESRLRHEILERLEQVSVLLLLPVFFVLSGMKVNLSNVDLRGVLELGLILAVAIGGKFIGAYAGARLQGVRPRAAGALATLMNTRGLTEIVILTVGQQLGILDDQLFSLMVVMALVTTAMAGPLLSVIYPRRRVEHDIAEAERAALGVPEAYRVFVVVADPAADDGAVALGCEFAGARRPAEVVLSHLVPYLTPGRLELGSGLSGELLAMTEVMGELEALAAPVRARGLGVPVLARLSADPVHELPAQIAAAGPDLVLLPASYPSIPSPARTVRVLAPPPEWDSVTVRVDASDNAEAALQVAAQLALGRGVPLVLEGRPGRRLTALLDQLTAHGLGRADAGRASLVVAPEAGREAGAHLLVRREADPQPLDPTEWAAALSPRS